MRFAILSACAALFSLPMAAQPAAPVDGTWVIQMSLMDNPMPETCTLHAEGRKLTGTCKMENGEADIVGEIDGEEVQWKHAAELIDNQIAFSFKGRLDGSGSMTGTMGIDAFNMAVPFTGKKQPIKKT